jgi:2,5-diamino-6-(ribosylamino)-4(3H)-pyrimidinone 5'-phosphate reductase
MLPRVILHNAVSIDGRIDWLDPDIGLLYDRLDSQKNRP